MKLKLILVLLLCIGLVIPAFAQEGTEAETETETSETAADESKSLAFTVNPVGLAFGVFNAQADIGLGKSFSLQIAGSYASYDFGTSELSWIGIGAGVRLFWQGKAVNGWYVNPFF